MWGGLALVAKNIPLPNVRKLFIPDPGMIIGECDLSGADAQVVAWDAGDEDLKNAFRAGLKVHIKNARDIFPNETKNLSDAELKSSDHPGGIYHNCKRGVHGTNYGASAKTLAGKLGWTIAEANRFQQNWFRLHPAIKNWHGDISARLEGRKAGNQARTLTNKFGFRITFFDRLNGIFPEALAWIPQSTVGINCSMGAVKCHKEKLCEVLLQVHDSFVWQMPKDEMNERLTCMNTLLHSIRIPYDDPLTIPWKVTVSDKSWGDGEEIKWP